MPRGFDSGEPAGGLLLFFENVECPACETVFEGEFYDDSMSVQDITEPPVGSHKCPECDTEWISQATGWTLHSEAG